MIDFTKATASKAQTCACCRAVEVRRLCAIVQQYKVTDVCRQKATVILESFWRDDVPTEAAMDMMSMMRIFEPEAHDLALAILFLLGHDTPESLPRKVLRWAAIAAIQAGWSGEVVRFELVPQQPTAHKASHVVYN